MVVGKTPAYNDVGEELQVVVQYVDRPLVNTTTFFVYRHNPVVNDIFPLTHLLTYAYVYKLTFYVLSVSIIILQGVSIACYAEALVSAIAKVSVYLSVCLCMCVTLCDSIKRLQASITKSSLSLPQRFSSFRTGDF